jgi:hypothetical protein
MTDQYELTNEIQFEKKKIISQNKEEEDVEDLESK